MPKTDGHPAAPVLRMSILIFSLGQVVAAPVSFFFWCVLIEMAGLRI